MINNNIRDAVRTLLNKNGKGYVRIYTEFEYNGSINHFLSEIP
ncbi:hypothetical protein F3D3_0916 [Fusibacter sp. 3D3]|nr:hypothetical protein F3D3_0916 [Fusibacter sp. 3D3]